MSKGEKHRAWANENLRTVNGYRLLVPWTYHDPYTGELHEVPTNVFITQPYSNGEHRCSVLPGKLLYIPRCLLRRTKTMVRKEARDQVLLGELAPKHFADKPV